MTLKRAIYAATAAACALAVQPAWSQPERTRPSPEAQPTELSERSTLRDTIRDRREARLENLTLDDLERIRGILPSFDPAFQERVSALLDRAEASLEADRSVIGRRILTRLAEMARLESDDPSMYDARLREFRAGAAILRAAKALRDASLDPGGTESNAYASALAALEDAIAEGHDARQAVYELEISRLEEQVRSYRARLDAAASERDERIREQLASMEQRVLSGERPSPSERGPDGPRRDSRDD